MSRQFSSCKGKSYCRENEAECVTCGRSLEEIYETRRLIDELANFMVDMDYTNPHEFMQYLLNKVNTKANHLNDQKQESIANGYH